MRYISSCRVLTSHTTVLCNIQNARTCYSERCVLSEIQSVAKFIHVDANKHVC